MRFFLHVATRRAMKTASHQDDPRGRTVLQRVLAVCLWFLFNISMSNITKWTFLYGRICIEAHPGGEQTCRVYDFPFMITAVHMAFCWVACRMIIARRPGHSAVLPLREQLERIAPVAVIVALSLVFGNLSLKYIYPSFNQMLSSISPLITVAFDGLLYGKRYNAWTWFSMPIICGGLLLCGNQEVNYNFFGVVFVVAATVLRAVKTVMQERLLDPKAKKLDSVTFLYHYSPWSGAFLALMSFLFEGGQPLSLLGGPGGDWERTHGVGVVLLLIALGGTNACFLNIAGNQVIADAGAVMLQVLGNVKACLSIMVSAAIFGNPVTGVQAIGVVISLLGVVLYQLKKGAKADVRVAARTGSEEGESRQRT